MIRKTGSVPAGGGKSCAVPDDRIARVTRNCDTLRALCEQQHDAAVRQYACAAEQQERVRVMFEQWGQLRDKMRFRAASASEGRCLTR